MSFLTSLLPSLIGIIPQVVGSLLGHGLIGGDQAEDFAQQLMKEARSGRPGIAAELISQLPIDVQSHLVGGALIGGRRKASRKGGRRAPSAYNKFVAVQRRKGYSMKQVGQMWRQKHGGKRKSVKRGGALIGGAKRKKSVKRRSVKPRSRSVGRRRVSFARDPLEHLKYAKELGLPGAEDELQDIIAYERTPRAEARRARKRLDVARDIAYDDIDFEAEEQGRIADLADRLLDEEARLGAYSPYQSRARDRLATARARSEGLLKKS